jgi:dihydroflavonol-4-reductase
MKTLVTGANGFLGAALVRRLAARGDSARALLRSTAALGALEGASHQRVTGDVTKPEGLADACAGIDVVFHLAGIRRASTREAFMQVNAEGTRAICEAMVQAKARRLVLVGSLAASGPSQPGRPRTEDDALGPQEWYGESKAEAERIAFGYRDRLEVVSCRPCRILGPGDRENLAFFKLASKGLVLKLGGPERRLSLVDVEDVVDHLLLLGDKKEAIGEAFFCAAEETRSLEQMMREIAELLGVKARTVRVPEALLRGLGAVADVVSNTTGKALPIGRKMAAQLLVPGWECSIEKSQQRLGWAPKVRLHDSIRRSAESYRQLGWL